MPRTSRVLLPNHPHHIIQRGHNRQVVFSESQEFQYYLSTLREFKSVYDIKVYAYCLMTNHVHLVVEPSAEVAALPKLMKRLAGRQTRYVNRRESRSGTLWEGRYKSSPIQTEAYLLACCRYVELNPVRARMVSYPENYRWSSYSERNGDLIPNWLDDHPCYLSLGKTQGERWNRYKRFVCNSIPEDEWNFIRQAVQRGQLTGNTVFIDEVEHITGRRIEHRSPGKQPANLMPK